MDLHIDPEKFDQLVSEVDEQWEAMLADPDSIVSQVLAMCITAPTEE